MAEEFKLYKSNDGTGFIQKKNYLNGMRNLKKVRKI